MCVFVHLILDKNCGNNMILDQWCFLTPGKKYIYSTIQYKGSLIIGVNHMVGWCMSRSLWRELWYTLNEHLVKIIQTIFFFGLVSCVQSYVSLDVFVLVCYRGVYSFIQFNYSMSNYLIVTVC